MFNSMDVDVPNRTQWSLNVGLSTIETARNVATLLVATQQNSASLVIVHLLDSQGNLEPTDTYVTVKDTPLFWNADMTPGNISAPYLMFHVMIQSDTLVNDLMYYLTRVEQAPTNILEQALPMALEWLLNDMYNPWMLDAVLCVRIASLQAVCLQAIYTLKVAYGHQRARLEHDLSVVDKTPWHLPLRTPFTEQFIDCIHTFQFPTELVSCNADGPNPDFIFERDIGVLCARKYASEKLAILVILLFSDRYGLAHTWIKTPTEERRHLGMPIACVPILKQLEKMLTQPPKAPLCYGS